MIIIINVHIIVICDETGAVLRQKIDGGSANGTWLGTDKAFVARREILRSRFCTEKGPESQKDPFRITNKFRGARKLDPTNDRSITANTASEYAQNRTLGEFGGIFRSKTKKIGKGS